QRIQGSWRCTHCPRQVRAKSSRPGGTKLALSRQLLKTRREPEYRQSMARSVDMTTLIRDFRFALRLLWQNKSFTAIAILALALGVGPNTAIFSVIYATLYAPMPYPEPNQLVMVWSKIQGNRNGIAAGDFLDWQRQSKSFQGLWAWSGF